MDKNQNTSIQMFADYEGDISTLLESNAPEELPVLATRNMVVFPGVLVPIFIGRKASVSLIRKLSKSEDPICAIFSQKDAEVDAPKQKDLYAMGVYAHLVRVIDMPGSENITAIFQAHGRCRLESITATRPYLKGTATPVSGVVPDVLDKALLRAGRFDRQIYMGNPSLQDRIGIFKVHLKKVKCDGSVDLDKLARMTAGLSGADIANICNEASLLAARQGKKAVQQPDFMAAIDRVTRQLDKPTRMTDTVTFDDIDAQTIFHKMERRNLAAAYKFYCGRKMEDDFTAHRADEDTEATYRVLMGELDKYAPGVQEEPDRVLENDMDSLAEFSKQNDNVDFAGRIVWKPVIGADGKPVLDADGKEQKVEVFNFGKYKGRPVADVLRTDIGYYSWMMGGDFTFNTKQVLTRIRLRGFNK